MAARGGRGGGRGRGRGRGGGPNAGPPVPPGVGDAEAPAMAVLKEPGPLYPPHKSWAKFLPFDADELAGLNRSRQVDSAIRSSPAYYTIPTLSELEAEAAREAQGERDALEDVLAPTRVDLHEHYRYLAHAFPEDLFKLGLTKRKVPKRKVAKEKDDLTELQREDQMAVDEDGEKKKKIGEDDDEEVVEEGDDEAEDGPDDDVEYELRSDDDDGGGSDVGGDNDEGGEL